ncbi:unnamed protein product [Rotaria magnacalcarata]|uniref:ZMYM2-like/QRICH1 C-terminal domain-containing protein n=1 Tax=Rotaria magnacalcarata TaxID=392030 RepID=A0A818W6Q8_9BILA|nr:unnamed protein product [Rotaria magnacalcarata]CAF3720494.1 unnamed protein product [Rotaria magnacalcarata]
MSNKQQSISLSFEQQQRLTSSSSFEHHPHQHFSRRRPLSWFQNRSRHHSSDDDNDSDRDSSLPSYSMSGHDNLGSTRRSTRVPKPKQDADFVTFPLLDRDEHGNSIPPTPSSIPLNKGEDDEDDIPYRLMDYPRPPQQSQNVNSNSLLLIAGAELGRKPRTVAEMRAAPIANKKQPRWLDDELYHVKSSVSLIIPQQITNPSTMKNKTTMCKPLVCEREVEAKPTQFTIATQTEMEYMIPNVPLVTLPVPIYLPSPSPSYRLFEPKTIPIPAPIFVPIMIPIPKKVYQNIQDYLQTQRDLLPDDSYEAALVMYAESLVQAQNQPQPTITDHINDSMTMMDLTRDDSYLTRSQAIENLPELDVKAHYIDPVTSNDPEVQKLLRMLPDAGDRLKWTYGVEAFQQWCVQCIQFYLNLNNRQIDLFDACYVEFNSTLNNILINYMPRMLTDSNSYVSLIDENLLYDIHQFGGLTPWSLLTTLIYINSKYFNLKTVESHVAISFANFGKYSQWVRLSKNSSQGQQMDYLRFYAHNPRLALTIASIKLFFNTDLKLLANSPTVYEITDSEQVRGAADLFYLFPIAGQSLEYSLWFSNEPLLTTVIDQILNRLKLLPDFHNQTKPVDTNLSSNDNNVTPATSTTIS